MEDVQSFHFQADINMALYLGGLNAQVPLTLEGDFQSPDRMRVSMSISVLGMALEVEMVAIGGTVYAKNPDTGEWVVAPDTGIGLVDPKAVIFVEVASFQDLETVGKEDLAGVPVYHLRGLAPRGSIEGLEGDLEADVWIGLDDNLLRRLALNGEVEVEESGTGDLLPGAGLSGTTTVTVDMVLSDYNQPVQIEVPEVTN